MPQITKSVYDIIEITSRGGVSPNNTTAYNSAKEATNYYYEPLDKAYWDSESWLSTPHLEQNRSEIYDDEEPYSFIGYRWLISRILLYWDISEIPDCGEITVIKMNYGIDYRFNPDNKLIFQVQRGELIYPHYPTQAGDFNEDNYETVNEFDLSDKGFGGYDPIYIRDFITDEEFIEYLNTHEKTDIRLMLRMSKDVEGIPIERTIKMTDGSWGAPHLPEIIITWTERPEIDNLQITVLPNGNISAEAEITNIRCSNCDTRGFSAVFSQAELSTAEKDELEAFFDALGWDYYSTYYSSSGWWVDAWKNYEEYGSFGVGRFSMELGELPAGFDYDIYAYCENEGGYTSTDGITVTINPYNVTTLRAELRAESRRAYTNIRLYGNIEEVAE